MTPSEFDAILADTVAQLDRTNAVMRAAVERARQHTEATNTTLAELVARTEQGLDRVRADYHKTRQAVGCLAWAIILLFLFVGVLAGIVLL